MKYSLWHFYHYFSLVNQMTITGPVYMPWNSVLNTRKLADSLSEPTIRRGSSHNNRVYNAQQNSLSQKSHVSSKRRTGPATNFLWTTSSYFKCDQLVGFTRRLTLLDMNERGWTSVKCVDTCSFAYLAGKWCNRSIHLFVPMPPQWTTWEERQRLSQVTIF